MGHARKLASVAIEISEEQERRVSGSTKKVKRDHVATLMGICHLKNAEFEPMHRQYKGRVVLRGDIVEDESGSYAVFTRFVCVSSDGRKCNGCHCETTRMQEKPPTQYLLTPR